jgi:UDP-N-acetylmuramate dehydrogenase
MQHIIDAPTKNLSAFKTGGLARHIFTAESIQDIQAALLFARENTLPWVVVGGGANVLFSDDMFQGVVILCHLRSPYKIAEQNEIETRPYIERIEAGISWDELVAKTTESGWSDMACLSSIPGTVGAGPVQNIGAYGQQISDSIHSVEVIDTQTPEFTLCSFTHNECDFAYRSSRFNTKDKGRYIITAVNFTFSKPSVARPLFPDVEKLLNDKEASGELKSYSYNEDEVSGELARLLTKEVRQHKLPNPERVPNSGSFFYNPFTSQNHYDQLRGEYPELKCHKTDDGRLKLYAGQLIELAGFKGYTDENLGVGVWPKQALVLYNTGTDKTDNVLKMAENICQAVKQKFQIELTMEPQYLCTSQNSFSQTQ